jgi:hypothetical protein
MLLGMLMMFFGAGLYAACYPAVKDRPFADPGVGIATLVFLAGFITGVVGFFRRDP